MRKLIVLLALIFTVTFSSPSFAEWTEVEKDVNGNTFYVDFERIRKVDGYIYYWDLNDYVKPLGGKYLSSKANFQGDCKLFRFKPLSFSYHKQPMGGGTGDTPTIPEKHKGWNYPTPNSIDENILKTVCYIAN